MSRRRAGVFYGWWNAAAGFVGMGLSYPMFTVFAFGVMVMPLSEEFGWGRGELSFAVTMNNLAVVIVSPCLGLAVDRLGVRRVLLPSIFLMGLAVAAMSLLAADIRYFYALYFLIPLLGAGTLPQGYSRVLIAWFSRRRGLALGVSLAGFGVGAMLLPLFAQALIDDYGWRVAYLGFALLILLVSLPAAAFVLVERPEEMGLRADGAGAEPDAGRKHGNSDDKRLTRAAAPTTETQAGLSCTQAAKTGSFWLILVSFMLVGAAVTALLAHLVPMLTDRGVAPARAALCMSVLGLGLIVGRALAGWLMDHFFAPYVTACFLLGLLAGVVILAAGSSGGLVFASAVCIGLALGSEISEIAYLCSRYFGPRAFGLIYGFMFAAFQLGSMIGAPLLGLYHDSAGDYIGALWMMAGAVAVGIALIAALGPYPGQAHRPPG